MQDVPPEDSLGEFGKQLNQCRAELVTERARWRSLIEDIADEVWLCDASGRMTMMNLNAINAMGLSEFKDRTVKEVLAEVEILYPDGRLRPPEEAPLLRSLRGEIAHGDEIVRHRHSGRIRHRRFSSAPIRDANGVITGAIAIVHDITDARQADLQIAQLNSKLVRRAAELKAALAHHAMELASMARLHEISTRLVRQDDPRKIQEDVLDAAIGLTGAEKGTIQFVGESGRLEMAAHAGFENADLDWLNEIQNSLAAADGPLQRGERIIIEDVARNSILRGMAAVDSLRDSGIHALQITPLLGRGGDVIGLLSTHYTNRRRPDEYSLRLLDMLARHATEIIMRRNAEAALRISEAAMRAFFDHTTVGAVQLDTNGQFTYVNDSYCRILGYSREELLAGMTPIDLTPPNDREYVRSILQPFLRGELSDYNLEHRHTRKDGTEIWIHVTAGLVRDDAGNPLRIAAIIQDISERKRADEELAGVAQFANENPDPVLRVAFDGRILYANHPAEHLMTELGWNGKDQAPPRMLTLVDAAREGVENEIEIKYGVDDMKSMGFTCVALPEKGYVNFYGRDTSERRRAEEALRQSQRDLEAINQTLEQRVAERTAEADARTAQLRKLASELTRTEQRERRRFAQLLHDHLQQLLVGAKFNASILERRLTDPNMRRYLSYVIELLDQSIASSRSLTIELSPPVLFEGKLVPALQWLVRWMEENHGLHISLISDDEVYPLDPDTRILLFQCVRELLFNVIKHAGITEATISVEHDDVTLRIIVEDRGRGFEPAELKMSTGGFSGLGLLNIRERLILHGGHLEITSSPGAGTRMTLSAPLLVHEPAAEPADITGETREPGAPIKIGQPIRVLIADDHAVVRDGLSQILQSDPTVEVVGTASDGQQAIELTASLQPDVVLMDVSMPRVSGIEATRRLHRTVNIIGLSMHSETDMAARMREAGAVDYLVKTAPPEEVITAIHNAAKKQLG